MSVTFYWKMALLQFRKNKLRSFLTVLGIVIGIAALIAVLSVGDAGQARIEQELRKFGVNRLFIFPDTEGVQSLRQEDVELLESKLEEEAVVCPQTLWQGKLRAGGKSTAAQLSGSTQEIADLESITVASGRFLREQDLLYSRKNIVLSGQAAEELFGVGDPVGEKVDILGSPYTVVGVCEKDESLMSSLVLPKCYVPASTMEQHMGLRALSEISVSAGSTESFSKISEEAARLITQRHGTNRLKFMNMGQQLENAQSILRIFRLVLAAIAVISLLVGGIGIMNIMLVMVKERTREIGVRKALGAKEKQIRSQFLAESVLYALIGSGVGVLLGTLFTYLAGQVIGLQTQVSALSILLAAGFSGAVGLLFGILPACRAARLNPVEALRQE